MALFRKKRCLTCVHHYLVSRRPFFYWWNFLCGVLRYQIFFLHPLKISRELFEKCSTTISKKDIPFKCASFIDEQLWIVLDMLWRHFTSKYPGDVSPLPQISFTINKKACLYLCRVIDLNFRLAFTYTIPHTPIYSRTHTLLIHTPPITHAFTHSNTHTNN